MSESAPKRNGTSAHPRYVAILAVSASVILLVGSVFRPRAEDPGAVPQMPESEITRLQVAAQRRSLQDDTDYFRGVATEVGPAVVFLPDRGTSGVAWGMNRVVTAGPMPDRASEMPAASAVDVDRPRSRPVVLTDRPAGDAVTVTPARVEGAIRAGDWVLAVWEGGAARAFVPGRYMGMVSTSCGATPVREALTTLPLFRAMVGAGLFDLDGNLLGVVAPCGARTAVLGASSVDAIIAAAATVRGRLLDQYGLEVAPLTEQETEHFGVAAGALVRAVWVGDRGEALGLMPGDVILSVDGQPMATVDDLAPLVATPLPTAPALTVRRAGASIELQSGATTEASAAPTVARDYPIENVPAGSVAARAGLRPGDRMLRLEQRAIRTTAEVTRLLAGTQSTTFVEVERAGRRWGLFIP